MSYIILLNGKQVDTPKVSFAQTRQVNDIANLTTRNSNLTTSVKLPKTDKNVLIIENVSSVGNNSNIPYTKIRCDVIDAITGQHIIYNGWAVLLETTETDYQFTFYDGVIDFYRRFENITMTELGLSDLNHIKNLANVKGSWNDTDLPYRYILADYNGNNDASGNVNIDFQVPCASVPYLWQRIFDYIGYSFVGTIFEHEKFQNLWLSYPKPVSLESPELIEVTDQTSILYTEVVTYPIGTGGVFYGSQTSVNFFPDSTGLDSAYYTLSGGAVVGGVYRLTFTDALFEFTSTAGVVTETATFLIWVFNTLGEVTATYEINALELSFIDINLEVGWRFTILGSQASSSPVGTSTLTGSAITNLSYINGYNLGFDEAFVDFKVSDFVKEICIRFGLTIFKDKYTDSVTFLTLSELLQNATFTNWSDKFNKKLSEKYTFGNYAKRNTMAYKYNDEEGKYNNGFIGINNENLAEEVTLLQSKIYSPEKEKNISFLSGSNIYKIWDKEIKDDESVDYKGLDGRFYFLRAELVNSSVTLGSNILGSTTSNDFYYRESYYRLPFQNIIDDFYNTISVLFNKAKLLSVDFWLKPVDIYNFDFSKLIYVDKLASYYLVNKINNFVEGKSTKVELIEVDYGGATPLPNETVDWYAILSNGTIDACEITFDVDTNYPQPVNVEVIVLRGELDVTSTLVFNELLVLPQIISTITSNEVTFPITQLPENIFGYRFQLRVITEDIFDTFLSPPSETIAIDGSCYDEPIVTSLVIISVDLISEGGLVNQYQINFTTDSTFPVQVDNQAYIPPSGFFGGWTGYNPTLATTGSINVFIGIIFGLPTKFQIKIGTFESAEFTL